MFFACGRIVSAELWCTGTLRNLFVSARIVSSAFSSKATRVVFESRSMSEECGWNSMYSGGSGNTVTFPRLACVFPAQQDPGFDESKNEALAGAAHTVDRAHEKNGPQEKRPDSSHHVLRLDQAVTAVAVADKIADESDVDLSQFLVAAERGCLTSSTVLAFPSPEHSRREDWRELRTRSDDEGEKKSKKPKLPPNYFVALPVYEASIHQAARLAQETITGKDPRLKPALIPLPTLHVTVMVMRLDTPEDILRAKKALNNCLPLLRPLISTPEPLAVSFKGLGHFRNQVIFITPVEDDALVRVRQLAKIVEDTFASVGLFSADSRSQFTPHLTLVKLSRAAHLRKVGIKHIDGSVYMDHLDCDFGRQAVTKIQLCSMLLPKDAVTGYYSCAEELDLIV